MRICIDPGHGGSDPGACANKLQEKEVNLKYALVLRQILESMGHKTLMTRENDKTVSLAERVRLSNRFRADLFISCHCNAATNVKASGVETLVYSDTSVRAEQMAQRINKALAEDCHLVNRGVKFRPNLYVLKHTVAPALLLELGFLTNLEDADKLKNIAFLRLASVTIAYEVG